MNKNMNQELFYLTAFLATILLTATIYLFWNFVVTEILSVANHMSIISAFATTAVMIFFKAINTKG